MATRTHRLSAQAFRDVCSGCSIGMPARGISLRYEGSRTPPDQSFAYGCSMPYRGQHPAEPDGHMPGKGDEWLTSLCRPGLPWWGIWRPMLVRYWLSGCFFTVLLFRVRLRAVTMLVAVLDLHVPLVPSTGQRATQIDARTHSSKSTLPAFSGAACMQPLRHVPCRTCLHTGLSAV